MTSSIEKLNPSGKRILLVDDDEHIRSMMQIQLEVEGFQIRSCRDGKSAMAMASEFLPDLIITDLMMPGVGGYDFIRNLQSDEVTRKIPIIMISGAQVASSTKNLMSQESNLLAFIEKPIHIPTFLMKIHKILHTKTKEERIVEEQKRLGDLNLDKFNF